MQRISRTVNKVYCVDTAFRSSIKELLGSKEGPFVQIGCGSFFFTEVLPDPKVLIEPFPPEEMESNHLLLKKKVQDLSILPLEPKILFSNLPFDQSVEILIHCHKNFKSLKEYYVLIQEQVADKMCLTRTALGFKMRYLFKISRLRRLGRNSFKPVPKVNVRFLKLEPLEVDYQYVDFLTSLKYPRKKLSYVLKDKSFTTRICEEDDQSMQELFKRYRSLNSKSC